MESQSDDFEDIVDTRRMSVMAHKFNPNEKIDVKKYPKTDSERKKIEILLKTIYIFKNLNVKQLRDVVDYLSPRDVTEGEVIMTEDDTADNFYIVEKGKFKASRNSQKSALRIYSDEGYFGELALIHNTPRCATITALSDGLLWVLKGNIFRNYVQKDSFDQRKKYETLLQTAKVLRDLNVYDKSRLSDALTSKEYKKGSVIVEEGKLYKNFNVILEGNVQIFKTISEKKVLKTVLKENDLFGHEGVLLNKSSSFSAEAETDCKIVLISSDAYTAFLSTIIAALKTYGEGFLKDIV